MARRKTTVKRSNKSRKNRRVIAYPAVLFMLLCAGVLLAIWTFKAVADNIVVTAKVPAAPVTGPAVITNPSDGQRLSAIPVSISGTCPLDGTGGYVKIYRNNIFSGVAMCDGSNNFSLFSDLFPGANTINAQIYNITDDAGPASTPITAYYNAAQPPAVSPPAGGGTSAPVAKPPVLTIFSDFKYIGYYVGQTTEWKLSIAGGTAPYAVNVNWGDGSNTVLSRKDAGDFSVDHQYKSPGKQKNHSYTIVISGSDAVGNQTSLQLFVIINNHNVGPVAASIAGATCSTSGISFGSITCLVQTKNLLKFLWPAYGVVLLMTISYVLGEREELIVLAKRGLLIRRSG